MVRLARAQAFVAGSAARCELLHRGICAHDASLSSQILLRCSCWMYAHTRTSAYTRTHICTYECPYAHADMYTCTPAHTRMHVPRLACAHSYTRAHTHTALRCATRILPSRSLCTVMPSVSMAMHTLQASQHSSYSAFACVQLLRFLLLAGFAFCPVMADPPSVRISMS